MGKGTSPHRLLVSRSPALPLSRSPIRQASVMASPGQGRAPVRSPVRVVAAVEMTVVGMTAEMAAPRCVMASIPWTAEDHDAGDPAGARVGAQIVGAGVALLSEPAVEQAAIQFAWAPIHSAMV
jgi:hypothetical protein